VDPEVLKAAGLDRARATGDPPPDQAEAHRHIRPQGQDVGRYTVEVEVLPHAEALVWAAEEHLPHGWHVTEINEGGSFDNANRKVKWGPFFDSRAKTLSYILIGEAGQQVPATLQGTVCINRMCSPVLDGFAEPSPTPDHPESTEENDAAGASGEREEDKKPSQENQATLPVPALCGAGALGGCFVMLVLLTLSGRVRRQSPRSDDS
jgi:hypothetical protein